MGKKKVVLGVLLLLGISINFQSQEQYISYSVNGKKFTFTSVKLQSSGEGGFIHLEGVKIEKVDFGGSSFPRYRDLQVGITIELSPDNPIIGTHTAHSSDIMPVYISWYETVKKQGITEVKEIQASMDSGSEDRLAFTITFEHFGPRGTLAKGTFNGKLLDKDGNSYQVTDGKYAVIVTDME